MSDGFVIHRHHGNLLMFVFTVLLAGVVGLLFLTLSEEAFERIGFSSGEFALIIVGTLVGSAINIPVYKARSVAPLMEVGAARVFGVWYRVPRLRYAQVSTTVAVNVGGAVIPILVSAYILWTHPGTLPYALVGTAVTAVAVHLMARKVRGVGIVTPALLPPLVAALAAVALAPGSPAVVAYVSGSMGALIGADLTNLRSITSLGAPMASIGGAGTFDGVFLSGLVAVLLAALF
ncbi:MAG: DUF1614 domain-containing protein [Nitrososphaerales archaeon]